MKDHPIALARALLLEHLDETERQEFMQRGHVTVVVPGRRLRRQRRFRVWLDRNSVDGCSVTEIDGGGLRRSRFCVESTVRSPTDDVFLAHVMMLKHCPRRWLRIAHRL